MLSARCRTPSKPCVFGSFAAGLTYRMTYHMTYHMTYRMTYQMTYQMTYRW